MKNLEKSVIIQKAARQLSYISFAKQIVTDLTSYLPNVLTTSSTHPLVPSPLMEGKYAFTLAEVFSPHCAGSRKNAFTLAGMSYECIEGNCFTGAIAACRAIGMELPNYSYLYNFRGEYSKYDITPKASVYWAVPGSRIVRLSGGGTSVDVSTTKNDVICTK